MDEAVKVEIVSKYYPRYLNTHVVITDLSKEYFEDIRVVWTDKLSSSARGNWFARDDFLVIYSVNRMI